MKKTDSLRSSVLRQALLNPELCHEMVHNGYEIERTASMAAGSLAHLAILEPEKFEDSVVLKEPRKGKEFDIDKDGKYMINPSTKQKLLDMQTILYSKENVKGLIEGEIEGSWYALIAGLRCIARPDIYHKNTIIDYKTVSNLKKNWLYSSIDAGYHIQFAHYHRVLETLGYTPKKWVHIVQSTVFPYNIIVYKFTSNYMQNAFKDWEQAMVNYSLILQKKYPLNVVEESTVDIKHYDIVEEAEDDMIFSGGN